LLFILFSWVFQAREVTRMATDFLAAYGAPFFADAVRPENR
jgi:hypothetical protein